MNSSTIIQSLIESAANDDDDSVLLSVESSLINLSKRFPDAVLMALNNYLQNSKSPDSTVLRLSEAVIREVPSTSVEEAKSLISIALKKTIGGNENAILVHAATTFPETVLESLLSHCDTAGQAPPLSIIKILGQVAQTNPQSFSLRAREVFSALLPVLGTLKASGARVVFAVALGNFCESLHSAKNSSSCSPKLNFVSESQSAYKVIYGSWLSDRSSKVRGAAAEALGRCSLCLDVSSSSLVSTSLDKLVSLLRNTRRESPERLSVLRGLFHHLSWFTNSSPAHVALEELKPKVETILTGLYPLASEQPDYKQELEVQRRDLLVHAEVLRCVEALASPAPELLDQVQGFLLRVLAAFVSPGNNNRPPESAVIAACTLLSHLVNSLGKRTPQDIKAGAGAEDVRDALLAGMRPLVEGSNLPSSVRLALAQLIVACGTVGFLISTEKNDETLAVGARPAILFVLRQCAISVEEEKRSQQSRKRKNDTSLSQLRIACENVLLHLSRCAPKQMLDLLFPAILDPEYAPALAVIVYCLSDLAEQGKLDYSKETVKLPPKAKLMARLLVAANAPIEGRCRKGPLREKALKMLQLLSNRLSPTNKENIRTNSISISNKTAESVEITDEFEFQPGWRRSLFAGFRGTLATAQRVDSVWVTSLGKAFAEQLKLYDGGCSDNTLGLNKSHQAKSSSAKEAAVLKAACLRYLGAVAAASSSPELVSEIIHAGLDSINHGDSCESHACAAGVGMAAGGSRAHLDAAIGLLGQRLRDAAGSGKKTGGWFGFGGTLEGRDDPLRGSIVLCFGQVAMAAPECIATHILSPASGLLQLADPEVGGKNSTKCPHLRTSFLRALTDIATAAASRGNSSMGGGIPAEGREHLIHLAIGFMRCGEKNVNREELESVRIAGTLACAELVKLPPLLSVEMQEKVVMEITKLWEEDEEEHEDESGLENIDENFQEEKRNPIFESISKLLFSLIRVMPADALRTQLAARITNSNSKCRLFAVAATTAMLQSVQEDEFPIGAWAATLIPRLADSNKRVRVEAVRACCSLLGIIKRGELRKADETLVKKRRWISLVMSENPAEKSAAIQLITRAFETKKTNFLPLLQELLIEGTRDADSSARCGASLAFLISLRSTVAEETVKDNVPALVQGLLETLGELHVELGDLDPILDVEWWRGENEESDEKKCVKKKVENPENDLLLRETKALLLHSLLSLATVHFEIVLTQILQSPLPLKPEATAALVAIAGGAKALPTKIEEGEKIVRGGSSVLIQRNVRVRMLQKEVEYLTDIINNVRPLDEENEEDEVKDERGDICGVKDQSVAKDGVKGEEEEESLNILNNGPRHIVTSSYCAFAALYLAPGGLLCCFAERHLVPLLATLLMGIATIHETYPLISNEEEEEESVKEKRNLLLQAAGASLRSLAQCSKNVLLKKALLDGLSDELCDPKGYDDAIGSVVSTVASEGNGVIASRLYTVMSSFITRSNVGQRIASTACCAAAVPLLNLKEKHGNKENTLLLERISDTNPLVRKHAVRGLRNAISLNKDMRVRVIEAMISSLEDSNEMVQLEALKAIQTLQPTTNASSILTRCQEMCCNTLDEEIRTAALRVVSKIVSNKSEIGEALKQYESGILPVVLAHLRSRSRAARVAALQATTAILGENSKTSKIVSEFSGDEDRGEKESKGPCEVMNTSTTVCGIVVDDVKEGENNNEIKEEKEITDFDNFIKELVPALDLNKKECLMQLQMVMEKSDKIEWAAISANSAIIAANFLSLSKSGKEKERVIASITKVMKENPCAPARSRAAQALGIIF
eukprot:g5715.t1